MAHLPSRHDSAGTVACDRGATSTRTWSAAWVATTSQLQPGRGLRVPWKTVHARRDGTHLTACGQPCRQWYSLWDLRIDRDDPTMCRDCLAEIRRGSTTTAVTDR